MKEHSVSHSTAPPVPVTVTYEPSVDELMTDWLAERVRRALDVVIEAAPDWNVSVRGIQVFGFESYEEPTRVIFVSPEIEAEDDDAYEYWGVLAETFAKINQAPPPRAENADVRIEIMVRW